MRPLGAWLLLTLSIVLVLLFALLVVGPLASLGE